MTGGAGAVIGLLFGDVQANGQLGDFIRQCDGIFVRREHQ